MNAENIVPPPSIEVQFQTLETKIDNKSETRILAVVEGRIVGQIGLYQQPFNIGCLHELYVEESLHGKGIGRGLVQAACQTALMRKCKVANLIVKRTNSRAFTLYYRLGFDVIGWFNDSEDIAMARRLVERAESYPPVLPV